MDNPNITMEEYIRLEEEKARRHGKVYNWETATYGKIWDNEDVHDLRSVETEFPAIVFNDTLTSEATLSCEPTVSSLNNDEIDFRISFDESDDEDCTLTKSTLSPQHIDEFNLKDETSLSECDEEEQNVLNFNDLFPFNVVYPDDLKSDKDNDDDKIDIEHSLGDLSVKPLPDVINTDVGAYAHGCPVGVVKMDDPNITIEEYIRLEEEKACRHGKVYNWESATYGKIWDNEDIHDLGYIETEFPAIFFNDTLTSEAALFL
ncbi:hypothetical protein Tco_0708453 [Tanacetum coccineum]